MVTSPTAAGSPSWDETHLVHSQCIVTTPTAAGSLVGRTNTTLDSHESQRPPRRAVPRGSKGLIVRHTTVTTPTAAGSPSWVVLSEEAEWSCHNAHRGGQSLVGVQLKVTVGCTNRHNAHRGGQSLVGCRTLSFRSHCHNAHRGGQSLVGFCFFVVTSMVVTTPTAAGSPSWVPNPHHSETMSHNAHRGGQSLVGQRWFDLRLLAVTTPTAAGSPSWDMSLGTPGEVVTTPTAAGSPSWVPFSQDHSVLRSQRPPRRAVPRGLT